MRSRRRCSTRVINRIFYPLNLPLSSLVRFPLSPRRNELRGGNGIDLNPRILQLFKNHLLNAEKLVQSASSVKLSLCLKKRELVRSQFSTLAFV